MKITKLPILKPEIRRKKVAAYARVSVKSEALLHSLANQVAYYSKLINSNPEWEYIDVYIDEGITGTTVDNRLEFKRMMLDAKAGKFDLLITKSVSRFARNTVDLLNYCRKLKSYGVEVQFEKDHISTFDSDGELVLSLLASFAQAESESISRNVKWGKKRQMQQGIYHHFARCYGYEWVGDEYKIVKEEAEVVRFIFEEYAKGVSPAKIAANITAPTVTGKKFTRVTVKDILKNTNYIGDRELQKYYSPKLRSCSINYGEVERYYISGVHEPIIEKELFEKVQKLMKEKAAATPKKTFTCFSGKVICGHCKRSCCRRTIHGNKIWKCQGNEISRNCNARYITEERLKEYTFSVFKNEEEFLKNIKHIELYDDYLVFLLENGNETTVMRKEGKRGCRQKR